MLLLGYHTILVASTYELNLFLLHYNLYLFKTLHACYLGNYFYWPLLFNNFYTFGAIAIAYSNPKLLYPWHKKYFADNCHIATSFIYWYYNVVLMF